MGIYITPKGNIETISCSRQLIRRQFTQATSTVAAFFAPCKFERLRLWWLCACGRILTQISVNLTLLGLGSI